MPLFHIHTHNTHHTHTNPHPHPPHTIHTTHTHTHHTHTPHTVPAERTVISKERSSGSYHLSAYYIAKTVSELPLLVILPTIFIIIVYWSAGLNGAASFFWSWFILLLSGLAAQVCLCHIYCSCMSVHC